MAERAPAFQFYPGDFLSSPSVIAMTAEQVGAYVLLLCCCWQDPDCGIPSDDKTLASMSRLGDRWADVGGPVREKFVEHPKVTWKITNERLLKERRKQKAWRAKCSKGGKASAESRASKAAANATESGSRVVEQPLQVDAQVKPNSSVFSLQTSDSSLPSVEKREDSPIGELSSSPSEADQTPNDVRPRPIREKVESAPPCPHQEIIELWHRHFPNNPRIRVWDEASKRLLAQRWRERKERQSLDFWERLFRDVVPKSDWLMGRRVGRQGTPFRLKLRWFTYQENLSALENGEWDDGKSTGPPKPQAPLQFSFQDDPKPGGDRP